VLKRKIAGPRRSLRGDQFLARGFTVHETCQRQGVDLWEFMHQAVHAFIANSAPPSLMPRPASVGVVPTG
jgi:transposase